MKFVIEIETGPKPAEPDHSIGAEVARIVQSVVDVMPGWNGQNDFYMGLNDRRGALVGKCEVTET